MTDTQEAEAGRLELLPGWGKRLGRNGPNIHWTCVTCQTSYPVIDGQIRCNGKTITACPYCAK
jgi:hypothetical protein